MVLRCLARLQAIESQTGEPEASGLKAIQDQRVGKQGAGLSRSIPRLDEQDLCSSRGFYYLDGLLMGIESWWCWISAAVGHPRLHEYQTRAVGIATLKTATGRQP